MHLCFNNSQDQPKTVSIFQLIHHKLIYTCIYMLQLNARKFSNRWLIYMLTGSIWVFNSQKHKKEKMQSHCILNLKFAGKSIKFEFGCRFGFELDKCFRSLRFRHANLWFDSVNFPLLRFIQKRNTKKFTKSSTLATLVLGIFPPYICM